MNVKLSPVFEAYIQEQLVSGLYQNASEVIRESLRLKMQQDETYQAKLESLKRDVSEGMASASRPWDFNEFMSELNENPHK